jgi:ribosomal protein S27AE
MSFIRSRLRRVEEAAQRGPCPECGPGEAADGPGHVVYHEDEGRPERADERCPRCGRPLWTVIKVVYEDEGGGALAND